MNLWLDDVRSPPSEDWVWVRTAAEAIALLERGQVERVSLDHDLGDDEGLGTGYQVATFIEAEAHSGEVVPPLLLGLDASHEGGEMTEATGDEAITIFKRKRPAGMIPFVLGVALLAGGDAAFLAGSPAPFALWCWVFGAGVAFTAIGVWLFRLPHQLRVTGDGVEVKGRFESWQAYGGVELPAPPSAGRVGLETGVMCAGLLALAAASSKPASLPLLVLYATYYYGWRSAQRVVLQGEGPDATSRRVSLRGFAEVAEVVAALQSLASSRPATPAAPVLAAAA